MRKALLFFVFVCSLNLLSCQGFLKKYNLWSNAYGGTLIELADGSIISSATNIDTVWSSIINDTIIIEVLSLYKVDKDGIPLWAKNYALNSACAYGGTFTLTPDSNLAFVSVAPRDSAFTNPEVLIFKLDLDGNIIWSKIYGALGNEYSFSVASDQTSIFTLGFSDSHGPGMGDAYLLKTDLNGTMLWSKVYPIDSVFEYLTNIHLDQSSNVYGAGSFYNLYYNSGTIFLKTDEDGDLQFIKTIYEPDTTIYQTYSSSWYTSDDHMLMIGSRSKVVNPVTYMSTNGIYLHKFTNSGNLVYSKCLSNFLDTLTFFQPLFIREKPNGDYVIFSLNYLYSSTDFEQYFHAIELTPDGELIGSWKIQSDNYTLFPQTCKLSDDGLYWLMNGIDILSYSTTLLKLQLDYHMDCGYTEYMDLAVEDLDPTIENYTQQMSIGTDSVISITAILLNMQDSLMCFTPYDNLSFPNVFTPNDDGLNDEFTVPVEGYSNILFSIYDRWGVLLYETKNPPIAWNGKNLNDAICTEGVYYYVFRGNNSIGQTVSKAGFLHLFY